MVYGSSTLLSWRVWIRNIASKNAVIIGSRIAHLKPVPGWIIIKTPQKAAITARYLLIPIFSPKKRLDNNLVTSIILRAMARAEYTSKNTGHYGLALKSYNHFTSPIRRYPDLIVHRIIKGIIEKNESLYNIVNLEKIGILCSENERNSESAERELQSILLCHYAAKFVGKNFNATVNSVVSFGLFISIKEEPIQGLVHISSLGNEYFIHNEKKNILVGDKSRKIF